jgi:allantoin racemase
MTDPMPARAVERRIAFINPFGTAAFDEIIRETLVPYASTGTAVDVIHLEGVPENIDYYYPKHLMELAIFEEVRRLEEAGYDAVVVGCCYDPGVRVARELVDIPVVGPLEAAMNHASYVGHRFTIVTDHRKAVPWLEDLVRLHGAGNCRGVRAIDWYVTDMIKDTTAVADDAAAACTRALREDASEVVILGCTIIGGCLEREIMTTGRHRELPILNPNLLALKAAESLADLHRMGKYQISRTGFYQRHEQHDAAEAAEVRRRWRLVDAGTVEAADQDGRSVVEAATGEHVP